MAHSRKISMQMEMLDSSTACCTKTCGIRYPAINKVSRQNSANYGEVFFKRGSGKCAEIGLFWPPASFCQARRQSIPPKFRHVSQAQRSTGFGWVIVLLPHGPGAN